MCKDVIVNLLLSRGIYLFGLYLVVYFMYLYYLKLYKDFGIKFFYGIEEVNINLIIYF